MAAKAAPRVPFALLVVGLILGGLVLLLALNTASAANELERHDLADRDQRVGAQVQQLRNEVALSAAPGNLARAAAELGMVPAGNPAFIMVGADGSVKVLGKPKSVSGVPVVLAPAPAATTSAKPSPTTKPTGTATPTSTTKPTGTTKTTGTAKTSGTRKASGTAKPTSAKKATGTAKPSPTPKPTPTPTPTPTLTLPGGHR